jgi:protein-L-isoaspartate(D-aspartate) O-methyltransferase
MNKQAAKNNMIKQQLRTNTVLDTSILELYESVDREAFLPPEYRAFAYSDMQIPLNHQQQMLTPLEEALILQALQLQGHERVLEIGSGTGFFSALLSKRADQIISIDFFEEFTTRAQKNCTAQGCTNIEFINGNGCQGWAERAPYDIVVITGGIETLTEIHKLQLQLGGKLFAIVGKLPVQSGNLYQVDATGKWSQQLVFETNTPLLFDKQRHQQFVF